MDVYEQFELSEAHFEGILPSSAREPDEKTLQWLPSEIVSSEKFRFYVKRSLVARLANPPSDVDRLVIRQLNTMMVFRKNFSVTHLGITLIESSKFSTPCVGPPFLRKNDLYSTEYISGNSVRKYKTTKLKQRVPDYES